MFIAALFAIAKTWKQTKYPLTDEWIKKIWYTYTEEYYTAIKKKEVMPFAATWIDLDRIILSEVSQTEKDKYHIIPNMWESKKVMQTNWLTKQTRGLKERALGPGLVTSRKPSPAQRNLRTCEVSGQPQPRPGRTPPESDTKGSRLEDPCPRC